MTTAHLLIHVGLVMLGGFLGLLVAALGCAAGKADAAMENRHARPIRTPSDLVVEQWRDVLAEGHTLAISDQQILMVLYDRLRRANSEAVCRAIIAEAENETLREKLEKASRPLKVTA